MSHCRSQVVHLTRYHSEHLQVLVDGVRSIPSRNVNKPLKFTEEEQPLPGKMNLIVLLNRVETSQAKTASMTMLIQTHMAMDTS